MLLLLFLWLLLLVVWLALGRVLPCLDVTCWWLRHVVELSARLVSVLLSQLLLAESTSQLLLLITEHVLLELLGEVSESILCQVVGRVASAILALELAL